MTEENNPTIETNEAQASQEPSREQTAQNETSTEAVQRPVPQRQKRIKYRPTRQPMGFGKTMLASALGVIIAVAVLNVLAVVMFIGLIVAFASIPDTTPVLGNDLALRVDLTTGMAEQAPGEMESIFDNNNAVSLHDVVAAIDEAATDGRVHALYLYAGDGGAITWAQSEELRNAVLAFRQSGKPVVAYGNAYSQPAYYLASAATSVLVHPAGMVDFRGMAAESMFYKDLLSRLGINVELIRPGSNSFKTAGEAYTTTHFSDANREQVRTYLNGIWNYTVQRMAVSRRMYVDSLNYIADNLEGVLAKEALSAGLVDSLAFEESAVSMLREKYGATRMVGAVSYAKSMPVSASANRIAVVFAEGNVVGGKNKGWETAVYSDDIVKSLDDAASDDRVKAIVLRINSPGGSAIASESMTDAVVRAKEKKPVVVSMGGVAASAGYEMASNATRIVAHPLTLTGSIGVFGVVPEVGTMLRTKLGITTDTVATNANAAGMSMMRPMSPASRAMLQRNVEDFYVTFCMRVAQGRGLEVEYVDSIARGRVWTGQDALRIGLVDTLGGLDVAMQVAAREAGIGSYRTVSYPAKKDFLQQLMELSGKGREGEVMMRMRQAVPFYDELRYWSAMDPLQARLPFAINID